MPTDSNRQARLIWTILAALGAILAVIGWYRWAMWSRVPGFVLLVAAAVGLVIWRGLAVYRYTFHKRDL